MNSLLFFAKIAKKFPSSNASHFCKVQKFMQKNFEISVDVLKQDDA